MNDIHMPAGDDRPRGPHRPVSPALAAVAAMLADLTDADVHRLRMEVIPAVLRGRNGGSAFVPSATAVGETSQ